MYPVNEIFKSLQGEAVYTGTPAVFIRLQGCNVGCAWCDTKHTWQREGVDSGLSLHDVMTKTTDSESYGALSTDELVGAVKRMGGRHVVITGGEPCMYDLTPLTEALGAEGILAQVETSGTELVQVADKAWVTLSPKFNMSGGKELRYDAVVRADEVKMPVGKVQDVELLLERVIPFLSHDWVQVWLQPLSQSPKATTLCIEQAAKFGFRVSLQTHKFIGVR